VEKDISGFIKDRGTGQEIPDPPRFINFCRGDINDTASEASEEDGYAVAQFQRTINPAFRSSSPQPSTYESHHDPSSELAAQMGYGNAPNAESRETTLTPQKPGAQPAQPAPLDLRRGGQPPPNYNPNRHGEIGTVPHNAYPTDGMTMFCRTGPPSERSSGTSAYRPSSREDSQSDISNATSFSGQEPASGKQSPVKPTNGVAMPGMTPEKQVQKKKSAFFSNSPFRRKSRHEKDRQPATGQSSSRSPTKPGYGMPPADDHLSGSPEPVDPRANFQLNIGNNVFDVASPDKNAQGNTGTNDLDPIARALADLKGVGKPSASRVSADRYHGISTPVPSASGSAYNQGPAVETPPPSYRDGPTKRLDAPQPAFTSAQMQKTTQKYAGQTQNMLGGSKNPQRMATRGYGPAQDIPRARSPVPRRSASPQPAPIDTRMGQYNDGGAARSPTNYQSNSYNGRYQQSPANSRPGSDRGYSPREYSRHNSPNDVVRAVSPQPQFRQQNRPSSANGMELQLSGNQMDSYGDSYDRYSGRGRDNSGRPMSMYHGNAPDGGSRTRSKSLAVAEPGRQFSRDGRPILNFGEFQAYTDGPRLTN
jgi:hypothetical protein